MNKTAFVQLVTASRLVFAIVVAVLTTWSGTEEWALRLSLGLVIAMELTDLADGFLARRMGVVTSFGKFFDPYADAVSRLIVFWSLSVIGLCWLAVPLVIAARDVTVAYVRVILTGAGRDVSARVTGKIKAWVLGLSAILLMFLSLADGPLSGATIAGFSIAVIAAVAVAGIHHLVAAWPVIREKLDLRT